MATVSATNMTSNLDTAMNLDSDSISTNYELINTENNIKKKLILLILIKLVHKLIERYKREIQLKLA